MLSFLCLPLMLNLKPGRVRVHEGHQGKCHLINSASEGREQGGEERSHLTVAHLRIAPYLESRFIIHLGIRQEDEGDETRARTDELLAPHQALMRRAICGLRRDHKFSPESPWQPC